MPSVACQICSRTWRRRAGWCWSRTNSPYRRAGADLKPLVYDLLAGIGRTVEVLTLPPSQDGLVHADLENVERGRVAIGGQPTAVVALGSGTVCDVAKHACFTAEQQDGIRTVLVLVPTAASVTAFTSSLAVLLVDGVKRTRPSRFPDAVLCDLEILADAPPAMTRAGLGDCVARFISYGDWYLAHQLGLVDRYSETPLGTDGRGPGSDLSGARTARGQGHPRTGWPS